MTVLTPQSEDFFYWAPEEILSYPLPPGPEDTWFTSATEGTVRDEDKERRDG